MPRASGASTRLPGTSPMRPLVLGPRALSPTRPAMQTSAPLGRRLPTALRLRGRRAPSRRR
eukprot:5530439-Lingulodinium_polyedra.AAC.1